MLSSVDLTGVKEEGIHSVGDELWCGSNITSLSEKEHWQQEQSIETMKLRQEVFTVSWMKKD